MDYRKGNVMGKIDDEEQLEYIRKWYEMKERKKAERKDMMRLAKQYFHISKTAFVNGIKCLIEAV